jgi:hypothetical protein
VPQAELEVAKFTLDPAQIVHLRRWAEPPDFSLELLQLFYQIGQHINANRFHLLAKYLLLMPEFRLLSSQRFLLSAELLYRSVKLRSGFDRGRIPDYISIAAVDEPDELAGDLLP